MKIKKSFFSLWFSLSMLSAATLCADDARPEAKQLLVAAHQASDLSPILPYTLLGTVVINPGTENQKKGNITIYRDHDRSRSELRVEDYLEVKVVRDNKLYIYRSVALPVPLLGKLGETDRYWDKVAEDGDAKLGDVGRKKVQNQQANCFDVKGEPRHRLCFNPEHNFLLEVMDQHHAVEFTNYSEVDGHFFPGKITVLLELEKEEKPVLVVENIQVLKAQFTDASFAIPPHAMEFDTCENMVAAKPRETPTPEFSTTAMRRNAGSPAVNIYGIIRKDGSLENVKVLTNDPEVRQTIMETVQKWRYVPAMCGASPVASEKEIQVQIFKGPTSSDSMGGRRGR